MNKPIEYMRSLNEVTLIPCAHPTTLRSRSLVDPYVHDSNSVHWAGERKITPIMCSPMPNIINESNMNKYLENGVTPIFPRIKELNYRIALSLTCWTAFSLSEFAQIVDNKMLTDNVHMVLIDMANGHLDEIYNRVVECKNIFPNTLLMVGNIDHPSMYLHCCIAGVDYVRIGIGGGSVCDTTKLTGIHGSHVWMMEHIRGLQRSVMNYDGELYMNSKNIKCVTKTIADGGLNKSDKIVKCLALGFDYVMVGGMFAHCHEACGETRWCIESFSHDKIYLPGNLQVIDNPKCSIDIQGDVRSCKLERSYYGMASIKGQCDISGGAKKNPEGFEVWVEVNTTLNKMMSEITDAIRSAMTYTDSKDLSELKESEYAYQSSEEYDLYFNKK